MDVALSVARVLLSMVFVLAAAGKLTDRPGTRQALLDFGVSQKWVGVGGVLLPAGELAIAVGLLARPTARWGALAAVLLLAAFTVVISRALRQGRTPDCHCFGQIHSAPAGNTTLARNLVLLGVAILIAFAGPGRAIDSQLATLSSTAAALLATSILSVILSATSVWLWRQNRRLRAELRRAGPGLTLPGALPVGSPAPDFSLLDEHDQPATLRGLLAGARPLVLVFISPDCPPCRAMMPSLARWQRTLGQQVSIVPISVGGDASDSRALIAEHGISPALIDSDESVIETYGAPATPGAIGIDPDGRIASPPVNAAVGVETLIRVTLQRQPTQPPAVGSAPVPE